MRTLILLFFCLISIPVFSQTTYEKTTLDGQEVFVYPFKIRTEFRRGEQIPVLPPFHDSLPDGTFLVYYSPDHPRWKPFLKRLFSKKESIDSTQEAIIFETKDGVRNGRATYFYRDSTIFWQGQFLNNLQEGKWSSFYQNGHRDSIVIFSEGLRNGPVRDFHQYRLSDSTCGYYTNNFPSGTWRRLGANGYLREYTYADSLADLEWLNVHSGYPTWQDWRDQGFNYSIPYFRLPDGQLGVFSGFHGEETVTIRDTVRSRKTHYYGFRPVNQIDRYSNGEPSRIVEVLDSLDGAMIQTTIYQHGKISLQEWAKYDTALVRKTYDDSGRLADERYNSSYYTIIEKDGVTVPGRRNYQRDGDVAGYDHHRGTWYRLLNNRYASGKPESDYQVLGSSPDSLRFAANFYSRNGKLKITRKFTLNPDSYYKSTEDSVSSRYFVRGEPWTGTLVFRNRKLYIEWLSKINRNWQKELAVRAGKDKLVLIDRGYRFQFTSNLRGNNHRNNYRRDGMTTVYQMPEPAYKFRLPTTVRAKGSYKNGYRHGDWKFKQDGLWFFAGKRLQCHYKDGKLDGVLTRNEKRNDWSKFDEMMSKRVQTDYWTYKDGVLHGPFEEKNKGDFYDVDNIKFGFDEVDEGYVHFSRLAGKFYYGELDSVLTAWFYNDQIHFKGNYNQGKREGKFQRFFIDGNPVYTAHYKNDLLDGKVQVYNENKVMIREYSAKKGLLDGEWTERFRNGDLKVKALYSEEDSLEIDYSYRFKGERSGSYRYYHHGEVLAAEGRIENSQKTGLWKFWNEGGQLIKQVEYFKEPRPLYLKKNKSTDTLMHFAFVEEWYDNGEPKSVGYLLDETSQYDCSQRVDIPVHQLYYQAFWNPQGEQTVKDGFGRLADYHPTGFMASEGEIAFGQQNGNWKFWDTEGNLHSVGSFVNGMREGRWLTGDLNGFAFVDDRCYESEEERQRAMRKEVERVRIVENIYEMGEIIKYRSFEMINGKPLDQ